MPFPETPFPENDYLQQPRSIREVTSPGEGRASGQGHRITLRLDSHLQQTTVAPNRTGDITTHKGQSTQTGMRVTDIPVFPVFPTDRRAGNLAPATMNTED